MASRSQRRAILFARDPSTLSEEDLLRWVEHRLKRSRETPLRGSLFDNKVVDEWYFTQANALGIPQTFLDLSALPQQGRWIRLNHRRAFPETTRYLAKDLPVNAALTDWPAPEKNKPVPKYMHLTRRGLLFCLGTSCVVCEMKYGDILQHVDYEYVERRTLSEMMKRS